MEIYIMTILKVFFNPTQYKKKKRTQKYVRVKNKF